MSVTEIVFRRDLFMKSGQLAGLFIVGRAPKTTHLHPSSLLLIMANSCGVAMAHGLIYPKHKKSLGIRKKTTKKRFVALGQRNYYD
jgi:hypothetical protein